jgi:hypothetical protein
MMNIDTSSDSLPKSSSPNPMTSSSSSKPTRSRKKNPVPQEPIETPLPSTFESMSITAPSSDSALLHPITIQSPMPPIISLDPSPASNITLSEKAARKRSEPTTTPSPPAETISSDTDSPTQSSQPTPFDPEDCDLKIIKSALRSSKTFLGNPTLTRVVEWVESGRQQILVLKKEGKDDDYESAVLE